MGVLDVIIIFFGILFKYLLCYGISKNILYILLAIICFFTIIDICYMKISRKEFTKIIFFSFISLYFVVAQQDVNFLISLLFALVIMKKDEEKFVETFFKISIFLFITTIILNQLNIVPSKNLIRYKNDGIIIRYSLGFDHPNTVFLYFLPIALGGYYLYNTKMVYYIFLIVSSIILYKFCDSRTGFICMLCIIPFHLLMKQAMIDKKITRFLINNGIIIFTLISIVTSILFGDDLTNNISQLFSGRPYYLKYYIKNNLAFSLLGGNYTAEYVLDNFYLYLLVQLGLVGYFIYYKIYNEGMKKIGNQKDYIITFLIFCLYGLLESNVIIGSINFLFAILMKRIIKEDGGSFRE